MSSIDDERGPETDTSSSTRPYTREEVVLSGNQPPSRGELCFKCHSHIPVFVELSGEDEKRLRTLARHKKLDAIAELRSLTGCSLTWAKIWVLHPHGPNDRDPTAPCPFCGEPLRTARAKQCAHCKTDWHDPDNPKKLQSIG